MAITPPYNDIEMKTAWAEDAATTIPSVPVPGISYRNTGISEETIANGQAYDNIGRSADWNQLLYKISANIVTMQKQGASLLWVSGRNYEQGSLVKDPNNAQIYYRLKAGAGTTRPSSDKTNWQLLQSFFMGEGLVLINNKLNWGLTGDVATDCNDITAAGVYRATASTANTPTDIMSSSFNGFIVCTRASGVLQQIAYETVSSGSFSMNTRVSTNNGTSWTAWTRFGVEFTLDWRSGGDYRAGDLVRDTSDSRLYVCTTAINNSTQRPGLDSTHFNLLSAYLAGYGLGVVNNEICWGGTYTSISDLNTATTPGLYWCSTSVANRPITTYGICMVIKNNANANSDNTTYFQLYFSGSSTLSIMYYRCGVWADKGAAVTWAPWSRVPKFDSLDFVSGQTYNQGQLVRGSNNVHYVKKTASSVCTTEPNADSTNFETLAQNIIDQGLLVIGNKINWGNCNAVSSPDANDALESGVYYVNTDAENIPIAYRGFIITLRSSNNANYTAHQLYFSLGATAQTIYSRTYVVNTGWNNWTKIGPADEVSASDLAGNGLTAASNKLNWGTASNVTNANSVTTPGTYALTSSSTNVPIQGGIMFVVKNSSGKVCQLIFNPATGGIYQRDNTSGSWSTWYNQTNSVGANMNAQANRSFGTTYTAETDGFIELTAYSNWRANTNGQLYINGNEIAVNHTGQYGSGGQSSGVQTTIYVRAGDQYRCNQGSLEYYRWYPNN